MLKKVFLNDGFVLSLVLINALIIFVNGFDLSARNNYLLTVLDNCVSALFFLELAVKLKINGINYFHSGWNKFDFILILLSLPAFLAFLLNLDLHDFSFLLVFRVMRVFKSLRFLKFIPGIDHLIRGINRALKASVIVVLGFLVYIFIIGIFSFYIFKEISPEYYRNPIVSMYSTFKIFTVEGWFEIPEQVASGLSSVLSFFVYLFYIFTVLSGGILGLSLVNSIFVDAMVSDNNDEVEKKIARIEEKIDELLLSKRSEN